MEHVQALHELKTLPLSESSADTPDNECDFAFRSFFLDSFDYVGLPSTGLSEDPFPPNEKETPRGARELRSTQKCGGDRPGQLYSIKQPRELGIQK